MKDEGVNMLMDVLRERERLYRLLRECHGAIRDACLAEDGLDCGKGVPLYETDRGALPGSHSDLRGRSAVSPLQPLCNLCWENRSPGVYCLANHGAVRLCPEDQGLEKCALCGRGTLCGLWVKLEAGEARYPKEERYG